MRRKNAIGAKFHAIARAERTELRSSASTLRGADGDCEQSEESKMPIGGDVPADPQGICFASQNRRLNLTFKQLIKPSEDSSDESRAPARQPGQIQMARLGSLVSTTRCRPALPLRRIMRLRRHQDNKTSEAC